MFTFVALFCSLRKRRRPGAARLATRAGVTVELHPRLSSALIIDLNTPTFGLGISSCPPAGARHRYGMFAGTADRPESELRGSCCS